MKNRPGSTTAGMNTFQGMVWSATSQVQLGIARIAPSIMPRQNYQRQHQRRYHEHMQDI